MAYPQVLIPPSVKPVSPMEFGPVDDRTTQFRPAFARGTTQRQTWGDPLWSAQLKYEALRGADRAIMQAVMSAARGGACNVLVSPGIAPRGSFPATELLTNNDFSNGTAGWSASGSTLSVTDRVMRVTASASGASSQVARSTITGLTQYAPYVMRAFIQDGSQSAGLNIGPYLFSTFASTSYSTARGLVGASQVVAGTAVDVAALISDTSGFTAGAYFETPHLSLSRCALIDNGPNALLYSDQIDNAAWTATDASIAGNNDIAPDGTATADALVDTGASTQHYVFQSATVASAAADYELSCSVKIKNRNWVALQLIEATGGTSLVCYFNASTGAIGTSTAVGANWSNLRTFSVSQGNGWYRFTIVGRKTNAATTLSALINAANSDGGAVYAGSSTSAITLWRATLAQSSVPTRGAQTTTTATAGTAQSGTSIYVKGLPASTSGLLLAGDFFEINGELKRCTASLDSDAAGLGVLKFAPSLTVAAADNDPIIVLNPFGRFTLAQDPRIAERFGVYTDIDLALIEATSA